MNNQLEMAEKELSFQLRLKEEIWSNQIFGGPFVLPTQSTSAPRSAAKRLIWC